MRLWTLHPSYLDRAGLLALWREALLAQAVLRGETTGYRKHPQLLRFQLQPAPAQVIAGYLNFVYEESQQRGYCFDRSKIGSFGDVALIPVQRGQLQYELEHLKRKLRLRDPSRLEGLAGVEVPRVHPLFYMVDGGIESWERAY